MPVYNFQCSCGVLFERKLSLSKRDKKISCPACNAKISRQMTSDVAGQFQHEVGLPVPQNTGVSDIDAHIDRVIGASAKKGWEFQDDRLKEKRTVALEAGVSTADLSQNPDGSWVVMDPFTKRVQENARLTNAKAMAWVQNNKSPMTSLEGRRRVTRPQTRRKID